MKKKSIIFLTDSISGGVGRVIKILLQAMAADNAVCYVLCVDQNAKDIANALAEVDCGEVFGCDSFPAISLTICHRIKRFGLRLAYSILERLKKLIPSRSDYSSIFKYYYNNYEKVLFLKQLICEKEIDAEIAFLNRPIFLSLLARSRNSKLIISERSDPNQFVNTKTTMAFIRKMYSKADEMVFQSPDVMQWYRENANVTGRVIFNPVKLVLPERYRGERKKKIVNFCRISSQKNLHLLLKAFAHFFKEYPEYDLYIYGDAVGNGTEGYVESINESIDKLKCKNKIHILPGQENIHNLVKDYAMFVSSSDYEGMSNSMLEAMAIGLPTICTDCPAGGARAVIRDHENGILVPVGDVQAMADAMKEVAANPDLAEKLSENGVKIRDDLSVDKIVNQWMEIIDG